LIAPGDETDYGAATSPKKSSREPSMNLKLVIAISVLTVMAAFGQAQNGAHPAQVPKPTMADVQKLVQTISSDKAKMQAYCDLSKLDQQMAKLDPPNLSVYV
jgi:hypothetical protein